jgi:hypothetical protein
MSAMISKSLSGAGQVSPAGDPFADEEPAHGRCWVRAEARLGDLRSLCGQVSGSVIAFLEAADHDKPGHEHGHHRHEQRQF